MIDLMSKGLPNTVLIGGEPFFIDTDFKVWMRFCDAFEKWDKKADLDISYIFSGQIPALESEEDMRSVLDFAYPPAVVPKVNNAGSVRILDYKIDADYIYSAFLGQYGIDLTEADIHWHKFLALFRGMNDSAKLHEIIGYRCYEGKEKDFVKMRGIWELPTELTEEDERAKEGFNNYFD